jgi:PAS domain-containing protein
MPGSDASRLRIAVIGLSGDEIGWASQLAGAGVEVVVVQEMRDLRSSGGEPGVFLGGAEGIGLLKTLLTGKREWEKTFDSIRDAIMVLDGDGRVVRANVPLARALGRGIQEIHGQ